MTAAEIKAKDQATIARIKAAGHTFQFGLHKDHKGRWSVYLEVAHRNDTKRLETTSVFLDAYFFDAANAKSYARLMRQGA